MEKICKVCSSIFNTNINRVVCCSYICKDLYKKTDEFKKQKYEYDKIRRATSLKWKETHSKYYKENSKEIYSKRKERLKENPQMLQTLREGQLRYAKTLKGLLHQKNNFAKSWIKRKYPGRYIEEIRYEQLLEKYNETNGICTMCKIKFDNFDLDHKISLKNGGEHIIENIHFICHKCNMKKGSKNLCDCHFEI